MLENVLRIQHHVIDNRIINVNHAGSRQVCLFIYIVFWPKLGKLDIKWEIRAYDIDVGYTRNGIEAKLLGYFCFKHFNAFLLYLKKKYFNNVNKNGL